MTTKACTQCGVVKPLAAFHKDKAGKFGRKSKCKECAAAYNRAYHEANREKIAAQKSAYREANREKIAAQKSAYREANREKIAAYNRAYREANREMKIAYNRAYYESNREKLIAYNRAYYESNREKLIAQSRSYHELIGNPTMDKWQEISMKHATRNREPWSEEEDRYLANSTARAIDDALALQRTFRSVNTRRLHLYRAGVIEKQYA